VTIGLPVYTGERFLEQAIDSLLGQTFTDFELIISDNASTDATEEICRKFAELDSRILYARNAENIGGMNNANLTIRRAQGEYFRLAAHDDYCASTLLDRCVAALDEHSQATVCVTGVVSVDADGNELYRASPRKGMAARASNRFHDLLVHPYLSEATSGLMRSDALKRTRLHENYSGSDYVLNCELALLGPWVLVDEPLHFKRRHDGNTYRDVRGRMAWARPRLAASGRPSFPMWLQLGGYLTAIPRYPLTMGERLRCLGWTVDWAWRRRRSLGGDLVVAASMVTHSRRWRQGRYEEERWR
jgi:glycosyltransferase involved in cell wall biosynthesis